MKQEETKNVSAVRNCEENFHLLEHWVNCSPPVFDERLASPVQFSLAMADIVGMVAVITESEPSVVN
jgi:hypothetical protein